MVHSRAAGTSTLAFTIGSISRIGLGCLFVGSKTNDKKSNPIQAAPLLVLPDLDSHLSLHIDLGTAWGTQNTP